MKWVKTFWTECTLRHQSGFETQLQGLHAWAATLGAPPPVLRGGRVQLQRQVGHARGPAHRQGSVSFIIGMDRYPAENEFSILTISDFRNPAKHQFDIRSIPNVKPTYIIHELNVSVRPALLYTIRAIHF